MQAAGFLDELFSRFDLPKKQIDVLQQAIEHEYPQLFRRTQRAARKTAR